MFLGKNILIKSKDIIKLNGKYISFLKLTLVEMGTNKRKSSELKKVDNAEGGLMWSRQTQNDKIN